MQFDRAKCEDEYTKMQDILLENPPESMKNLYASAADYRKDATEIYRNLTYTVCVEFPGQIRTILEYTDPADFSELEEKIHTAETPETAAEYTSVLNEFLTRFRTEGDTFNGRLRTLCKSMRDCHDILEKNLRKDLTSGAFFYGQMEIAMQLRGRQIEELASIIKDVYVAEMNELKEKIKKYDESIDQFLDPKNAFDRFMKALPSADEFASLTKFTEKNPDAQVEAMKAAYSVAIKGITYIGDKIVNVANMEERESLQKELDRLQADYDKYKAQYENVIHEYNLVKNLVSLMDSMRYFSNQAGQFSDGLSGILAKLDGALTDQNAALYHSSILEVQAFLAG